MSEWIGLFWIVMVAFWIGALWGQRSERKHQDTSHVVLAREIISVAKGIKQVRKFTGDEVLIVKEMQCRFGDEGEFLITVSQPGEDTTP